MAAAAAAAAKKDEGAVEGESPVDGGDDKMALVKFLVEEMGCDVNGMDVAEGEKMGNHYGPPMNYVARGSGSGSGGEEMVVRYLLDVRSFFFFFPPVLHPRRCSILCYTLISLPTAQNLQTLKRSQAHH